MINKNIPNQIKDQIMQNIEVKLYETFKKEATLNSWLWQLTSVFNWTLKTLETPLDMNHFQIRKHKPKTLEDGTKVYPSSKWENISRMTGKTAKYYIQSLLKNHSKKCCVPLRMIHGVITQAVDARDRFLKGQNGKPKFKGKRNKLSSFLVPGDFYISGNYLTIPGMKLKFRGNLPEGKLKQVRIIKRASGWYACLTYDSSRKPITPILDNIIGIDPGLSNAITTSEGEIIENPRFYEKKQILIGQAQRRKNKKLAATRHEKLKNQRKDFHEKVSLQLAKENKEIYTSKDNFKKLSGLHGKSYGSLAPAALFSRIQAKVTCRSDGLGKFVWVDPRNSTKTCNKCGTLTGPSGLKDLRVRHWTCGACGEPHDRDVNAAKNALMSGIVCATKISRDITEIL